MQEKIAVYAASFDPVTYGHLDVIERVLKLSVFDLLIVAVGVNPDKSAMFSVEERVGMLKEVTKDYPNVLVESYVGLTTRYATERGASVIIRGLRAFTDFEYEYQLTQMNRRLAPNVDTMFMMASEQHSYLRSSLVKQIAQMGNDADLDHFVPPTVAKKLKEKCANLNGNVTIAVNGDTE